MADDEAELSCLYCGQPLSFDPEIRTERSAWHVAGAEQPTACLPSSPGHTPDNYKVHEPGVGH